MIYYKTQIRLCCNKIIVVNEEDIIVIKYNKIKDEDREILKKLINKQHKSIQTVHIKNKLYRSTGNKNYLYYYIDTVPNLLLYSVKYDQSMITSNYDQYQIFQPPTVHYSFGVDIEVTCS